MSTLNHAWLITEVPVLSPDRNGDHEWVYAMRVGDDKYLPGFCDRCEDTMVEQGSAGRWSDGDCIKCGRGGCSVAYSCAATKELLMRNVAMAMFPADHEAKENTVTVPAGSTIIPGELFSYPKIIKYTGPNQPMFPADFTPEVIAEVAALNEQKDEWISVKLTIAQHNELVKCCSTSDTTINEVVVGAMIKAGLVNQ